LYLSSVHPFGIRLAQLQSSASAHGRRDGGKELMKTKGLLWLAVFAIFLSPAQAAEGKSFEGKWLLDEASSSANPMVENLMQEIKHDGNGYKVISTWKEPKDGIAPLLYLGIMQTEVKLSNDGSETVNFVGPYRHQSKTRLDGQKLVSEWVAGMKDGEPISGEWIRELSPDGNQMTLHIKTSKAGGTGGVATLVFKRK
jgi:hypothetical protein